MSRQLPALFWISVFALRLSAAFAGETSELGLLGPRQGVLLLRKSTCPAFPEVIRVGRSAIVPWQSTQPIEVALRGSP